MNQPPRMGPVIKRGSAPQENTMNKKDFYSRLKEQLEHFISLEPDVDKQRFVFGPDHFTIESLVLGLEAGTLPLYKLNLSDADRVFLTAHFDGLGELTDMLRENSPEAWKADELYNGLRLALPAEETGTGTGRMP
jgi:hypothetical protein